MCRKECGKLSADVDTGSLFTGKCEKKRPEFAGEVSVDKQKASAFYEKEAEERRYLKGYEGYDKRQLRKTTHLEQINGNLYVFDYRNRNVLTNQASVFW